MQLKIGETKTMKLAFWQRAIDVRCEDMGMRIEHGQGNVYLYINNGSRFKRFCTIPLGRKKDVNAIGYTVKAQSKSRILFSMGQVRFVIDYAAKKVATNLIGLKIYGSKEWGEQVQSPWRGEYQVLFGLPKPPMEMDKNTAELFWRWFLINEGDIITLLGKGKKEEKMVFTQIDLWLCPVFPYVKASKIDFDLECSDEGHTFKFYHGGNEQLAADAEIFASMMPEGMTRMWSFEISE